MPSNEERLAYLTGNRAHIGAERHNPVERVYSALKGREIVEILEKEFLRELKNEKHKTRIPDEIWTEVNAAFTFEMDKMKTQRPRLTQEGLCWPLASWVVEVQARWSSGELHHLIGIRVRLTDREEIVHVRDWQVVAVDEKIPGKFILAWSGTGQKPDASRLEAGLQAFGLEGGKKVEVGRPRPHASQINNVDLDFGELRDMGAEMAEIQGQEADNARREAVVEAASEPMPLPTGVLTPEQAAAIDLDSLQATETRTYGPLTEPVAPAPRPAGPVDLKKLHKRPPVARKDQK